jgi:hypothetical protein
VGDGSGLQPALAGSHELEGGRVMSEGFSGNSPSLRTRRITFPPARRSSFFGGSSSTRTMSAHDRFDSSSPSAMPLPGRIADRAGYQSGLSAGYRGGFQ